MQAISEEKIFDIFDNPESITFAPGELKYFFAEIESMRDNGEIIDLSKAIHNARYFAKLERSERQLKEGKAVKFTAEEWENFVNAQNI